jgi:hypothetical protein
MKEGFKETNMSSGNSIRNFFRCATIGFFVVLLSACSGVQVKCEVQGNIGTRVQQQAVGPATNVAVVEANITGSMFIGSETAAMMSALSGDSIDASSITMDTSGSNVQWPLTGSVSLTIRNKASNAVLAARSFPWARSGSVVRFSNPAAVDAWLSSSGANASQHKVDYAFQNLTMPAQDGTNLVAVDVYQGNVPRATASVTVPYDAGRPNCPPPAVNCHIP